MRADRLLSILLLLQSEGTLSAGNLANRLEVSRRTIYRDIIALSTAGIPVYMERGPNGGCSLVEDYRTNLTGMTEDEIQALFMLSIPAVLGELGLQPDLENVFRKLSASLSATQQKNEIFIRQRFFLDSTPWFAGEEPLLHLHLLQQAVWKDRRIKIAYRKKRPGYCGTYHRPRWVWW